MQKFIAICLLLIAAVALFKGEAFWGDSSDRSSQDFVGVLEKLVRASNESAKLFVEQKFSNIEDKPLTIIHRWKSREYTYQSILNAEGSPKLIWLEGKKIRASDFRYNDELLGAVSSFVDRQDLKYQITLNNAQYFLLWKGFYQGKPFVAVYRLEDFFRGIDSNITIRNWIVDGDGKVIYHDNPKLLGEQFNNLKAIALARSSLQGGAELQIFDKFILSEGKERYGVVGTLSAHGLIIITEWKDEFKVKTGSSNPWNLIFVSALCLSILIFVYDLFFFARSSGTSLPEITTDTTASFLQIELENLRTERDSLKKEIQRVSRTAMPKVDLLRAVEKLVGAESPREISKNLLIFISQYLDADGGVFFKYSGASCSLIPELNVGTEGFDPIVQRFWSDSRIFIGTEKAISSVKTTEAFTKWDLTRQKFMGTAKFDFEFIALEKGRSVKGVFCLFKKSGRYFSEDQELNDKLLDVKNLITIASYLYDNKQRLLEFKNEKSSRERNPEDSTNRPRA